MNGKFKKTATFFLTISLVSLFFSINYCNAQAKSINITEADCTVEKIGSSIPVSAIGEFYAYTGKRMRRQIIVDASAVFYEHSGIKELHLAEKVKMPDSRGNRPADQPGVLVSGVGR